MVIFTLFYAYWHLQSLIHCCRLLAFLQSQYWNIKQLPVGSKIGALVIGLLTLSFRYKRLHQLDYLLLLTKKFPLKIHLKLFQKLKRGYKFQVSLKLSSWFLKIFYTNLGRTYQAKKVLVQRCSRSPLKVAILTYKALLNLNSPRCYSSFCFEKYLYSFCLSSFKRIKSWPRQNWEMGYDA